MGSEARVVVLLQLPLQFSQAGLQMAGALTLGWLLCFQVRNAFLWYHGLILALVAPAD
jgi:hypothetical protein